MDAYEIGKRMGELLRSDRDRGALLSLAEYQKRYPGHERLIALEYAIVGGREEAGDGAGPTSQDWLPAREREHYSHLGEVARGGMGAILRVRDETLGRELAMKVVLGEGGKIDSSSPATQGPLARRFIEEAKVTARLDHPGVVPVHELGADAEGRLFFTMKLVKGGRTLADVLRLAREGHSDFTQSRVVQMFVRVLETLAFAHEKGVIHRDLKPANVMIGDFGEVYVMDWGLAKVGEEPARESLPAGDGPAENSGAGLTEAGQILGTPAYMPIEQARNDDIDARVDIYAVGAMLYEFLSGVHPYGNAGRERTGPEVVLRMLKGPPEPLRDLAPDAPAEVVSIIEKAMARDRGDRYPDAMELARDLRNFAEGRVVLAHEAGTWAELRKWIARNRSLSAAIATAVALLIAGFVTATVLGVKADRERAAARHHSYRAEIEAAVAHLANQDLRAVKVRLDQTPEDLRGWEWAHLRSRVDESLLTIEGRSMALRADGALRVIDGKGVIHEYRPSDGTSREVTTVPFDGAKVWITKDGEFAYTLREDPERQSRCRFRFVSIDGRAPERSIDVDIKNLSFDPGFVMPRFVYQGLDHRVHIRDLDSGADWVPGGLDAGGHLFARPSWDGRNFLLDRSAEVILYDLDRERALLTIDFSREQRPSVVALDPSRKTAAIGAADGGIDFWDLSTARRGVRERLPAHAGQVAFIAYDPTGRTMATGGFDRTVKLFNASTGALLRVLTGHLRPLEEGMFSRDGAYLITRDTGHEIRVWSVGGADPLVLRGHRSYVYSVAVSPDGARIYSGGWDGFKDEGGSLRIWDLATGTLVASVGDAQRGLCILSLAVTSDGKRVITVGSERPHFITGPLTVWDAETGRIVLETGRAYRTLALHPGGRYAAAAEFLPEAETGDVYHILDLVTGEVSRTFLPRPVDWVAFNVDPAFSPDGRILATPDPKGTAVILWDTETWSELRTIRPPGGVLASIRFSPDGSRLLTSVDDDSWRVWEVATAREIGGQAVTGNEILSCTYSGDGRFILTGGRDRNLTLWDAETFEEIIRLPGHQNYIKSIAASPREDVFVTASGDGTVRIWQTRAAREIHTAQVRRRALVAELSPRVNQLYDELGDPAKVVARLRSELRGRAQEVALQLALSEAVSRNRSTAESAPEDD